MAPVIINWRTRIERWSGVYKGGGFRQCFYIKLTKLKLIFTRVPEGGYPRDI